MINLLRENDILLSDLIVRRYNLTVVFSIILCLGQITLGINRT